MSFHLLACGLLQRKGKEIKQHWGGLKARNKIKTRLQYHLCSVWPLNFKASSEPSPKSEPLKLRCISWEFCPEQVHSVTRTAFITPIYPDPSSRQMLLILTLLSQMFHGFPLKSSAVSPLQTCVPDTELCSHRSLLSNTAFTSLYRGRLTSIHFDFC